MKAVLVCPPDTSTQFLSNLIDRLFLRHVVDFIVSEGIRDITVVGPAAESAKGLLGDGGRWGASIGYLDVQQISDARMPLVKDDERVLLASAVCLPRFPLRQHPDTTAGAIVNGVNGERWTGWAIIEARHVASMPPLCDLVGMQAFLEGLPTYSRISADREFRCDSSLALWTAHRDAQESNLADLCHDGLEVRQGIWIGRNASVPLNATIIAPAYIGENSWIGAGATIGPFAVIARDCLIAPNTTVRHAVVAPGTYAGNNLDLHGVLVDQHSVFDVRFGLSVDRVGFPVLDGVFDFHWSALARRSFEVIASVVLRPLAITRHVVFSAWSKVRHGRRPGRVKVSEDMHDGDFAVTAARTSRKSARAPIRDADLPVRVDLLK